MLRYRNGSGEHKARDSRPTLELSRELIMCCSKRRGCNITRAADLDGLLHIETSLRYKGSEGLGCNHVVQDWVRWSACEHGNNTVDLG